MLESKKHRPETVCLQAGHNWDYCQLRTVADPAGIMQPVCGGAKIAHYWVPVRSGSIVGLTTFLRVPCTAGNNVRARVRRGPLGVLANTAWLNCIGPAQTAAVIWASGVYAFNAGDVIIVQHQWRFFQPPNIAEYFEFVVYLELD